MVALQQGKARKIMPELRRRTTQKGLPYLKIKLYHLFIGVLVSCLYMVTADNYLQQSTYVSIISKENRHNLIRAKIIFENFEEHGLENMDNL